MSALLPHNTYIFSFYSSHTVFYRLGNIAFAAKDYDVAIAHYSDAIKKDRTNHVFYSNRRYVSVGIHATPFCINTQTQ